MTAAEIVIRLLLGAFSMAAGAAVIMPAIAERHAPLAVGIVLITGTMALAVGVRLYMRNGGGDRG